MRNSNVLVGLLLIVFGVLILVLPSLLSWLVGILLIIVGVLALLGRSW